jgi:hypothetical protein
VRMLINLTTDLITRLQDEARSAHRTPRMHAEWLLEQALRPAISTPAPPAPQAMPDPAAPLRPLLG